jgi:glucosamine--fructose-6-phosphate aminotransferase (isomerizing)
MCGIVGYVGKKDNIQKAIIKGLKGLEYRGYDSAGMAVAINNEVNVYKNVGAVAKLEEVTNFEFVANRGIGHTRWATHGKPSVINSHPHQSSGKRFTVVHNGIIENYEQLKEENNINPISETDTEIVVELLELVATANPDLSTVQVIDRVIKEIHGSFAFGIIDANVADTLFAAKRKSPMLIGIGNDFNMIGSDMMAMINYTTEYFEIMDDEIIELKENKITIYDQNMNEVKDRKQLHSKIDLSEITKGPYEHYMLKEINEQPGVMRKIMQQYYNNGKNIIDQTILNDIKDASRIYILAAGTSYHAGLVGKSMLENIAGKPTEVHIASEFVYNTPLLDEKSMFIFISQSGETADSRACLVKIKEMGYKALTITNVEGSTLSREADHTLLLFAGPEIAVASTKAYTAQIAVLSILADAIKPGSVDVYSELSVVASAMENTLTPSQIEKSKKIVTSLLRDKNHAFYIGRKNDYALALEAALKLKEISYIHTEGFAAGELKHGTIALIEEDTPVIALVSCNSDLALSTRSNKLEVEARGAKTATISMANVSEEEDDIVINSVNELFTPIVMAIPVQLISYFAAIQVEANVDMPRNLAKSVTVE